MGRTVYLNAYVGKYDESRELRDLIIEFDGENITIEDDEADISFFVPLKELMAKLGEAVYEKDQASGGTQ